MSRKSKELIILVVLIIVASIADPLGMAGKDVLTTFIMVPLVYAVPSAIGTVLISKLLFDTFSPKPSAEEE